VLAERSVADYAKSCIYIARYYLHTLPLPNVQRDEAQQRHNLIHAKEYLLMVSESNAEEIGVAADLLRRLNKLTLNSESSSVGM
jgi:ATP adenylyltransferase/5',5'''-P-1,P-4-tetraphosphate phosphorylase II